MLDYKDIIIKSYALNMSGAEIALIHLFEVVEIVRAFWIDTLMDDKVLAVLLWN